jgi:hypothetical protein
VASNADLLIKLYPRLFHMTHEGSWPGIQQHGLLSTTALLDLFEVTGERREQLEVVRRAQSEEIVHPKHGRALLRDQKPLNEKKLKAALTDGLTTEDWCRNLNGRVFFWGPETRLGILRGASEYKDNRQTIVVVDTAKLVQKYADQIELCHMNSGCTMPMAFPRGKDTFLPLEKYPLEERRKKYGTKNAVAEITIKNAVPDVTDFVIEVYETGGEKPKQILA